VVPGAEDEVAWRWGQGSWRWGQGSSRWGHVRRSSYILVTQTCKLWCSF
jgi:hypothetical protein